MHRYATGRFYRGLDRDTRFKTVQGLSTIHTISNSQRVIPVDFNRTDVMWTPRRVACQQRIHQSSQQ